MGSKSSPQFSGQINYLTKSCRGAPPVFSLTLCTLLGTNISPFCKGTLESKILQFPFGGICHIVSLKVCFSFASHKLPPGQFTQNMPSINYPPWHFTEKNEPTNPSSPTNNLSNNEKNNDETKKHRPASVVSRCSLA